MNRIKKYLLVMAVSIIYIGTASAQRYLPGQRGLEFTGGFVNGFKISKEDGQAFYGNVSMSTYTKKGNRWVFGTEYMQKQFEYRDVYLPVAQITVEGGHYFKFLSDGSKTLFFSIGGSAITGYETLNWGKRLLYDGAMLEDKDSFIYGGAISFEIETYLSDRFVFLVRARERIIFGSAINRFHFQVGAGIKVIIN
ncbi:conjugal transfer protein TraO [Bacteroides sp. 51]|uniref:conjugal transfer protein TraO n=1 Tax=Bacteroides sp. 51 TaxID=2302938 RepID=UPI0013D3E74F|nr:conjugal transfer protein TraO [Bacteroides sp. 51]NDV84525.1 conjugal transfer protein [Bacteroides sp. 51]